MQEMRKSYCSLVEAGMFDSNVILVLIVAGKWV